eukprot:m.50425 g.50425  ORF g.50425 m.50425 type:complete len:52 (-) comp12543_c1_seq1:5626-5781(-)
MFTALTPAPFVTGLLPPSCEYLHAMVYTRFTVFFFVCVSLTASFPLLATCS